MALMISWQAWIRSLGLLSKETPLSSRGLPRPRAPLGQTQNITAPHGLPHPLAGMQGAAPMLQRFKKSGAIKKTHKQVHYRPATKLAERCGTCSMFRQSGPHCTAVQNPIKASFTCDIWAKKPSKLLKI
jgi:hypothetical protein